MDNMKKTIFALMLAGGMSLTSCLDDGYMDIDNKISQTEATAFITYDNFKTYAWKFYNTFDPYYHEATYANAYFSGDYNADNMIRNSVGTSTSNIFTYGTAKVNETDSNWNYSYIRNVNLLLDHIDASSMSDEEKEHWRSVGYFFRSLKYYQMLSRFGAIPWIEHVLTDESPELYAPRDSRDLVARNILDNLLYAEEHIKEAGDGDNTINVHVVRALLSRFGLFEGTWRKYHGLPDAETYLKACAAASEKLIAKFPTLHKNYEELFNSEDLAGVDGILLFKKYEQSAQVGHAMTRVLRTGETQIEATKDAVDSYLCSNGLPIRNANSGYDGEYDIYKLFANRDPRLYYTVGAPYKVNISSNKLTWTHTGVAQDRIYIDLMEKITGPNGHRLPHSNFNANYNQKLPNYQWNQTQNWGRSYMGFWVWKYYNTQTDCSSNGSTCTTDAPLFRMGEVLLNYAEAKFELGEFSQAVADQTINKLRRRAGSMSADVTVADMTVSQIGADFDPARDQSVDPVLWEIRRERRVELMGESFRLNDIRRWKKGEYLNKQPLGMFCPVQDRTSKALVNADGYLYYYGTPVGWDDKYYLYPIPLNQRALNPNLEQNPGWETTAQPE